VTRVFLIAASPLARAALQNRLKPQGVKIVGTAASIDVLVATWESAGSSSPRTAKDKFRFAPARRSVLRESKSAASLLSKSRASKSARQ
jgi:hypothetical protein